jgi:hypothetical protein
MCDRGTVSLDRKGLAMPRTFGSAHPDVTSGCRPRTCLAARCWRDGQPSSSTKASCLLPLLLSAGSGQIIADYAIVLTDPGRRALAVRP